MHKLNTLGWNPFFENHLHSLTLLSSEFPARVIGTYQHLYRLNDGTGRELLAEISGKFEFEAESQIELPVTGDWVIFKYEPGQDKALITNLFPRQTQLTRVAKTSRKNRGSGGRTQVLAANVDLAFIAISLNQDFNLRRIERYFTLVSGAGIQPVILLTKSDLCIDLDERMDDIRTIVFSTPIYSVSAYDDLGKDSIMNHLAPGTTAVLLGSSGAGKSTLINWVSGQELIHTNEISDYKDKGKHTTTNRFLVPLEGAGMVIDTPGIRELTFDGEISGLNESFADIIALENECQFKDCTHFNEPGCAILEAIGDGRLEAGRLENYQKIGMENLKQRLDTKERKDKKRSQKELTKAYKQILKNKQRLNRKY